MLAVVLANLFVASTSTMAEPLHLEMSLIRTYKADRDWAYHKASKDSFLVVQKLWLSSFQWSKYQHSFL